jgi:hypothetical protein
VDRAAGRFGEWRVVERDAAQRAHEHIGEGGNRSIRDSYGWLQKIKIGFPFDISMA